MSEEDDGGSSGSGVFCGEESAAGAESETMPAKSKEPKSKEQPAQSKEQPLAKSKEQPPAKSKVFIRYL